LDELRKHVKEVKRAILDTLNNDEDMAMMYLTATLPPPPLLSAPHIPPGPSTDDKVDTMGLEMLFENYLNEVEWIASEIEEVIDEITNTEEYVVLQLDLLRNRILKFELLLSISSFVVTSGALITGLFGMNLMSHFETSKGMFYVIFAVITMGMTGIYKALTRYAKKEKLF
jgi:magnesium transporter